MAYRTPERAHGSDAGPAESRPVASVSSAGVFGRNQWPLREILPHEPELRRWLYRNGHSGDWEDIAQLCYVKLLAAPSVAHVTNPRSYLLSVARRIVLDRARHDKVVRIECRADIAALGHVDETGDVERIVDARCALARIDAALSAMHQRRREVLHLRRHLGLTLRATAETLGISQSSVEKHLRGALDELVAAVEGEAVPAIAG